MSLRVRGKATARSKKVGDPTLVNFQFSVGQWCRLTSEPPLAADGVQSGDAIVMGHDVSKNAAA